MHLAKWYERNSSYRRQLGVTMLELMIVAAIITMIATFAYPSYVNYVVRAKRTAGTTMLLQIADRQQQFFMDNKQYAANLTDLGFASDAIMINDEGAVVGSGDDKRVYGIALSNTGANTYTVTASPQLRQASKDTKCGNLTLTHTGEKGHSGTGANCW